jgi:hypothetical protein
VVEAQLANLHLAAHVGDTFTTNDDVGANVPIVTTVSIAPVEVTPEYILRSTGELVFACSRGVLCSVYCCVVQTLTPTQLTCVRPSHAIKVELLAAPYK